MSKTVYTENILDFMNYTPVAQFAIGLDHKITFWNKPCELLTGYLAADMVGSDLQWKPFYTSKRPVLADLLIKKDFKQFLKLYENKGAECSEVVPYAWEAVDFFSNIGGRSRTIHFLATPIFNASGSLAGAMETLLEVGKKEHQSLGVKKRDTGDTQKELIQKQPTGWRNQFDNIVGESLVMMELYKYITKAASTDVNVIVYGESGTGKELVARAIHDMGNRSRQEFVPVNCGAIPEALIESQFFGYVKGAFTGADRAMSGFLDRADGGTLFLDEVGEISLSMQVKLLRAIEGGGFSPVGSNSIKNSDFRVIAATKRDLMAMVQDGTIREDFFYRIHILPLRLPALREHLNDIPMLVDHFIASAYAEPAKPIIPENVMEMFLRYNWPGNVRELQNRISQYLTFSEVDLPISILPSSEWLDEIGTDAPCNDQHNLRRVLHSFEKEYLIRILNLYSWQKQKAAAVLGISRKTLARKIKNFDLSCSKK